MAGSQKQELLLAKLGISILIAVLMSMVTVPVFDHCHCYVLIMTVIMIIIVFTDGYYQSLYVCIADNCCYPGKKYTQLFARGFNSGYFAGQGDLVSGFIVGN